MIKSFVQKGFESFFQTGNKRGIQPHHADRLRRQLTALNNASSPTDLNAPGWGLHQLKGESRGLWSITVNGNWRITFRFVKADVDLVDYLDDH
jgi:proteic killer suppression protein